MPKTIYSTLYALLMVALIVGVDILFLRDQFWLRLVVNVGIVDVVAGTVCAKAAVPISPVLTLASTSNATPE